MRTTHHISRSLAMAATIAGLALVLAACGSSSSSSSTTSTPAASGSTTSSSSASGTPVSVTLKDFSISMPKIAMHAGTYTFNVTNNGPSAHNLTIDGPGVSNAATPTFASGDMKTLTVTLKKGKYDFFCSVPGHKQAGMNVEVAVS